MKNVLFICVANAARSQMAEGLATHHFKTHPELQWKAQSAGSRATAVSIYAIEALKEKGIDASQQYSKSIDDIDLSSIDLVVTLCAQEQCPVLPGSVKKLDWSQPDPEGRQSYFDTCDIIEKLIQEYAW